MTRAGDITTHKGSPAYYRPGKLDICVDLDGVVADTCTATIKRAAQYGIEVEIPYSYDYAEYPDDVRQFIFSTFEDYSFYRDCPVMYNAHKALWALTETHNITAVSARGYNHYLNRVNRTVEAITWDWLIAHNLPISQLIITAPQAKVAVVQSQVPEARAMVEDKAETAIAFARAGFRSWLIDYPYNQYIEEPGVVRVFSLLDVARNELARAVSDRMIA